MADLSALIARLEAATSEAWATVCTDCGRFVVSWKGGCYVADEGSEACEKTMRCIPNAAAIASLKARMT